MSQMSSALWRIYKIVLKNPIFSGNRREKFKNSQQFYTSFFKNQIA